MAHFDFSAFDRFEENVLYQLETCLPYVLEQQLMIGAGEVLEHLKAKTVLLTKDNIRFDNLEKGWQISSVISNPSSGWYRVSVFNDDPRASSFENGYSTNQNEFIKGKHIMMNEMKGLETQMIKMAYDAVEKMIGSITC